MADFNNLTLTVSGIKALLTAQSGTTLTLTKIGMGSGSTNNFTSLTNLITPEVMLPISEKKIDEDSGFMSIVAKMTNEDIAEGFYWRETGLFFEDSDGNDVLFAYACVIDDHYDYVPAYSDKRYVKHVRIADIITDSANITVEEKKGLLYVDTLTFEKYKEFVAGNYLNKAGDTITGNGLYMADGFGRLYTDENVTQIEHFTNKKDNKNRRQLIVNDVSRKGESAIVVSDWENGEQRLFSLYGTHFKPTPQDIGSESMSALADIGTNTSIKETIKNYYAKGVKSGRFFSTDNVSDNPEANWSFGIEFLDCGRSLVLVRAYKTQVYATYYRQLNVETGEYLYDWVCDFNTGNKPTPADVECVTYGTQRILINENGDLNNYLNCGGYKCINNTTVETLKNCPVNMAFTMDVLSVTGATDKLDVTLYYYIVQTIRTLGGEMWYREVNSNASNGSIVYGEWKHVATHDTVPVNNNILINSNFANPINQRGNDALSVLPSVGAYTIDRWKASNISLTLNNGYITAKSFDGSKLKLLQIVEFPTLYSDKTLTASLKYRVRGFDNSTDAQLQIEADGVANSTVNLICDETWHVAKTTSKLGKVSELRYNLMVTGKGEIDIEWSKLEEGEHETPYVPRLYAEEWLLCRRYFKKLYLGSSNLFQINTDDLLYCMSLEGEMRVPPTITFPTDGTTVLAKNGVPQNGFTFEGVDMTVLSFLIRAKKTSHGISYNDIPTLRRYVYADSEL